MKLINKIETTKVILTKKWFYFIVFNGLVGVFVFNLAYLSMSNHILLDGLNQPILSFMLSIRSIELTDLAKFITNLASPLIIASVTAIIIAVWFLIKKEIWRPALLMISIAISTATSLLLKLSIKDIRPPQLDMIPAFETDYSFPSGHTLSIAVLLFVTGYLVYSRSYNKKRVVIWFVFAFIGTGLIAASRLYLGYHWLTDVSASLGLGLLILSITMSVDRVFIKKLNNLE